MAEITTENIKKLREITGAGIMDCKKALSKAEGDFEKAQEILRQKGAEKAEKKKDRATNSGLVKTLVNEKGGVIIEVNCETDFVASNEEFKAMTDEIAQELIGLDEKDVNIETMPAEAKEKVNAKVTALIGKIGENMSLKRCLKFAVPENGLVTSYVHMGGKIGVLIALSSTAEAIKAPETAVLAKDLTMQIAAQAPKRICRECYTAEELEKQKKLIQELAAEENPKKPANIVERIANGKLEKFFEAECLVDQMFIKDPSKKVAELIKEVSKKVGGEIKVERFVRYCLGE